MIQSLAAFLCFHSQFSHIFFYLCFTCSRKLFFFNFSFPPEVRTFNSPPDKKKKKRSDFWKQQRKRWNRTSAEGAKEGGNTEVFNTAVNVTLPGPAPGAARFFLIKSFSLTTNRLENQNKESVIGSSLTAGQDTRTAPHSRTSC